LRNPFSPGAGNPPPVLIAAGLPQLVDLAWPDLGVHEDAGHPASISPSACTQAARQPLGRCRS
jgi:hypothetical protein